MSYLVDTNILLRLVQKNSPTHSDTQRAILILKRQGELLYIIPQNLIEFWAVAINIDDFKRFSAIVIVDACSVTPQS